MNKQESFPVLSIGRDNVKYALGFDPGLSDKHMEILTAALHDALREKGLEQLLEDTLDELFDELKKEIEEALGVVAPEKVTVDYEQKYCLECIHFDMSIGEAAYSEYTPGTAGYMACDKGYWHLGCRDGWERYYKERICDARTCPDFEPDPELAKIGKGGQANGHGR